MLLEVGIQIDFIGRAYKGVKTSVLFVEQQVRYGESNSYNAKAGVVHERRGPSPGLKQDA